MHDAWVPTLWTHLWSGDRFRMYEGDKLIASGVAESNATDCKPAGNMSFIATLDKVPI
jgi:hypothetical protein